ncbi:MAG: hypothetical protein R3Y64_10750 [Peptostreptococcaceae bacterium]
MNYNENYLEEIRLKLMPYPKELEDKVESFLANVSFARLDNNSPISDESIQIFKKQLNGEINVIEAKEELKNNIKQKYVK